QLRAVEASSAAHGDAAMAKACARQFRPSGGRTPQPDCARQRPTHAEEKFRAKIENLRRQMQVGCWRRRTADGVDESGPLTVLDGNHRLIAAVLSSPKTLSTLRFFCGLSPKMTQCCWYKTNLATLLRYGTNLVRHAIHDPEAELTQLLQSS